MEMTETLRKAIEIRNISRIHSVFYTIAHEDPSFETGKYEETLRYVKNLNLEGFIAEHNGEEFRAQEEWNKEYWAEVASELQDNFSQKRIEHLIEVGKYVYGKKSTNSESVDFNKTIMESNTVEEGRTEESSFENNNVESKDMKKQLKNSDDIDRWLFVAGIFVGICILIRLFRGKK